MYLADGEGIVEPAGLVRAIHHGDHDASGVEVLPVRVANAMFVLEGRVSVHFMVFHVVR